MYRQIQTSNEIILANGAKAIPLATLQDEAGGIAHIWGEDRYLQLGVETNAFAGCPGDPGPTVTPIPHICREALEVMARIAGLTATAQPSPRDTKRPLVEIECTGKRDTTTDPTYNTGVWRKGQIKMVPMDVAVLMVKDFPGVFARPQVAAVNVGLSVTADVDPPELAITEETKKQIEQEKDTENTLEDARDLVARLDTMDALREYAFNNFGQKLHPALKDVTRGRQLVVNMIDQFGVPS